RFRVIVAPLRERRAVQVANAVDLGRAEIDVIYLAAIGALAPAGQPLGQDLFRNDYAREANLLALFRSQFFEQTRLIERARITVEDVAVIAIGLRSPRPYDFGENLVPYQSPRRHRLLDLSPQRSIGARHFAQNVTCRDLRVAVFLREQPRLCSLACARRADYHDNLRHRKLIRAP